MQISNSLSGTSLHVVGSSYSRCSSWLLYRNSFREYSAMWAYIF